MILDLAESTLWLFARPALGNLVRSRRMPPIYFWAVFFVFGVFANSAHAASSQVKSDKKVVAWVKGTVNVDQALIYSEPDFDAPTVGTLNKGKVLYLFPRVMGAFYKVQIKQGQFGYVLDTEIKPQSGAGSAAGASGAKGKNAAKKKDGKEDPPKKKKPFEDTSFRGLSFSMINYREETMGLRPTESLMFLGFRMSGPDVLVEGTPGELNVDLAMKPPQYYQQATGEETSGFIILISALLENTSPQGKNTMFYYGFGPMLKYSKFDVGLEEGTKKSKVRYSLDDMSVGAVFNLGFAQRIGSFALRADMKYFWEQQQYTGFSLSGQMEF